MGGGLLLSISKKEGRKKQNVEKINDASLANRIQ
jgi:hypothetical protein